jgi:hypothetical protein
MMVVGAKGNAMTEQVAFMDDGYVVVCYGNAKLTDVHLASTVRAVDDGIIRYLQRREDRRRSKDVGRARQASP